MNNETKWFALVLPVALACSSNDNVTTAPNQDDGGASGGATSGGRSGTGGNAGQATGGSGARATGGHSNGGASDGGASSGGASNGGTSTGGGAGSSGAGGVKGSGGATDGGPERVSRFVSPARRTHALPLDGGLPESHLRVLALSGYGLRRRTSSGAVLRRFQLYRRPSVPRRDAHGLQRHR